MKGWRIFDRTVQVFNAKFDRTLNHLVRPRPKLNNGRTFLELLADEVSMPGKKPKK